MKSLSKIRNEKPLQVLLLVVFLLVSVFPPAISAAKDYTVETIPNVRLSDRDNHVSNPDGIIRQAEVDRINRLLKTVEDSLGIEIAVVAVKSIGDNDPREFATDLFQHWGLGKKDKDNGLLIQLVTDPPNRSIVFETGYGLEGVLPDAITARLQHRYMLPDLKAGNYSEGMLKGAAAVKEYLLGSDYERRGIAGAPPPAQRYGESFWMWWLLVFIILLPGGLSLLASYRKHRPRICPRCGKRTLIYTGQVILQKATYQSEGVAEDVWRCKNCGYSERNKQNISRLRRSSGPVIFGGGGLGGGFGGGFGGFGGGGGGSWGGGRSGGGGSITRF